MKIEKQVEETGNQNVIWIICQKYHECLPKDNRDKTLNTGFMAVLWTGL